VGHDRDGRRRLDHGESRTAPCGQRCFGRPPAGLAYRIVDDQGSDAAPGAAGELLVRREGADPRRGFFAGYYKDEAATSQAWAAVGFIPATS